MNALAPTYGEPPARVTEPIEGRPLPMNLDAEQALLAILLNNNDAMDLIGDQMQAAYFADPLHGRIYDAVAKMFHEKRQANPVTLKPLFDQDQALVDHGGAKYLVQIAQALTSAKPGDIVDHLIELAKRRAYITALDIARAEAMTIDLSVPVETQMSSLEASLANIGAQGLQADDIMDLGDLAYEAAMQSQQAMNDGGGPSGIMTGIDAPDDKLGGMQPADLIVLAARPSMGKTALATTITENTAEMQGSKVLFFSKDMSRKQITARFIASQTGLTARRQRRGEVGMTGIGEMVTASDRFRRLGIKIDDRAGQTVAQMTSKARKMKRTIGLDLVVVDHLGKIGDPAGRSYSRYDATSANTNALKNMAKVLEVPVLLLCQLSRANEKRDDKRPQMADLRDSGSIEQDADVVMFVYREAYYTERTKPVRKANMSDGEWAMELAKWDTDLAIQKTEAEIDVAKNRMDEIGTVKTGFDGPRTRFTNYEKAGQ